MKHSLVLALLATAACNKVDSHDMEQKIKDQIAGEIAPVDKVSCPSGQSMDQGTKFDCQLTFVNGPTFPMHVEIQADHQFVAKFDREVADTAKLASGLTDQMLKKGAPAGLTVDCGTGIQMFPEDGFVCTVNDPGGPWKMTVTDTNGDVEWHQLK